MDARNSMLEFRGRGFGEKTRSAIVHASNAATAAVFIVAGLQRLSLSLWPFADGDTFGYLHPAITLMRDGVFVHTHAREFLYPGFLYLLLRVFGDFRAITIVQHLFGLLTGGLLLAAWSRVGRALPALASLRLAHAALRPFLLGSYLLSADYLNLEHTIRPECPSIFLSAVLILLGVMYVEGATRVRPLTRWVAATGAIVIFVSHVLLILRPQFGAAIVAVYAGVLAVAVAARFGIFRVAGIAVVPSIAAYALLWLPESRLSAADPMGGSPASYILLFTHFDIAADILRRDLESSHVPESDKQLIDQLLRQYDAERQHKPGATNRAFFDILFYGKSGGILWTHFGADKAAFRRFCLDTFLRAITEHPLRYIEKVFRQIRLPYSIAEPRVYPREYFIPVGQRLLASRDALVQYTPQFHGSAIVSEYLAAIGAPYPRGEYRALWIAELRFLYKSYFYLLSLLYTPTLLLAAIHLCISSRSHRNEQLALRGPSRLLMALGLSIALVAFSSYLTVAAMYILEIQRYINAQCVFVLFSQFTAALGVLKANGSTLDTSPSA